MRPLPKFTIHDLEQFTDSDGVPVLCGKIEAFGEAYRALPPFDVLEFLRVVTAPEFQHVSENGCYYLRNEDIWRTVCVMLPAYWARKLRDYILANGNYRTTVEKAQAFWGPWRGANVYKQIDGELFLDELRDMLEEAYAPSRRRKDTTPRRKRRRVAKAAH